MPLTIVTHTRGDRSNLLARSALSVAQSLPDGAIHRIIACNGNFSQARIDSLRLDEYIAWVDDDDVVAPGAISKCYEAILETGAGVAFTNEQRVTLDGRVIRTNDHRRTYEEICNHPREIHNLCVIRTSAVDINTVAQLGLLYGHGVEWLSKANAALVCGAVHVPMVGYYWTAHPNSRSQVLIPIFNRNRKLLTQAMNTMWPQRSGPIPTWDISK